MRSTFDLKSDIHITSNFEYVYTKFNVDNMYVISIFNWELFFLHLVFFKI